MFYVYYTDFCSLIVIFKKFTLHHEVEIGRYICFGLKNY